MIFNCREIVSAASRYFKLNAGDLVFTGTPSGVMLENQRARAFGSSRAMLSV